MIILRKKYLSFQRNIVNFVVFLMFTTVQLFPFALSPAAAQPVSVIGSTNLLNLPSVGAMVFLSEPFEPVMVKGLALYPDNPLKFDFFVDPGDDNVQGETLKQEAQRLIKYFMAALTVPEDELWVNLSPYEEDRIIAAGLSRTELGRDLLAQDYLLKQITASLMYPEEELGRAFWDKVYAQAQAQYGTSDVPMNTFNKVWIIPQEANVYINGNNVFVVDHHLKVMLEQDYLALEANQGHDRHGVGKAPAEQTQSVTGVVADVVREVILPAIEKEVNEGRNFANLRQMFNAMILATWYKQNFKQSLLGKVYANKNKIEGIDLEDKNVKEKIYDQYIEAFEKGVYDYIREDYDELTRKTVPRKYFSGGIVNTSRVGQASEGPDKADLKPGLKRIEVNPQPVFRQQVPIKTAQDDHSMLMRAVSDEIEFPALEQAGLDVDNARKVPWKEIVRRIEDQPLGPQDDEQYSYGNEQNQLNYWSNMVDVRELFLSLVQQFRDGRLTGWEQLMRIYSDMNSYGLLGKNSTYLEYRTPTMKNLYQPVFIAGQYLIEDTKKPEFFRELNEEKFRKIFSLLKEFTFIENTAATQDRVIYLSAEVYYEFMRVFWPFIRVNNSLAMNILNGMIRLHGLNGISHGNLDNLIESLLYYIVPSKEEFFVEVFEMIQEVNPDAGINIDLLRQKTKAWKAESANKKIDEDSAMLMKSVSDDVKFPALEQAGLDVDNARKVPWREVVADLKHQSQGPDERLKDFYGTVQNQTNYWNNMVDIRENFLRMVQDARENKISEWQQLKDRYSKLNYLGFMGKRGDSLYTPPHLLSYQKITDIAGEFYVGFGSMTDYYKKLTEEKFKRIFPLFTEFSSFESYDAERERVIYLAAEIYYEFMRVYWPFIRLNNSLAMNIFNGMLRMIPDFNGISHGSLDRMINLYNQYKEADSFVNEAYYRAIFEMISEANPNAGIDVERLVKKAEVWSKELNGSNLQMKTVPETSGSGAKSDEDPSQLGGIDFNPQNMELNVDGDQMGINFPLDGDYNGMVADGFIPVIINISPVIDIPMLLGEGQADPQESLTLQSVDPALDPEFLVKNYHVVNAHD